jgi:hypothetical protein
MRNVECGMRNASCVISGGQSKRNLKLLFPFSVLKSALRTPHSSFRLCIPHSALLIPHSAFLIPHSALRIPHSAFRIGRVPSYLLTSAAVDTGCALPRWQV